MNKNTPVLVVDAGNTFLKVALFENGEITNVQRVKQTEKTELIALYDAFGRPEVCLSSVLNKLETNELFSLFEHCFVVNQSSDLPITLDYRTKETLGIDRICNAVASYSLRNSRTKASVSIDIGTCVKFDFVNESGSYLGGSISPGIQLRYQSMHDYTANLPLLSEKGNCQLIGQSTYESMQSGVMNGMQSEIDHFIDRYRQENGDLTFFVTGGDAQFFDFGGKNDIFVNENLTLIGLYQIFQFNAH